MISHKASAMIVLSVHSMLLQNLIKAAGDGTFAISEAVVNLCSFLLTLNNQDIIRTFGLGSESPRTHLSTCDDLDLTHLNVRRS